MAILSEHEVRAKLSPYHDRIKQVVCGAYDEWLVVDRFRATAGFGTLQYSRTLANYVFDAIARNAQRVFSGDSSVRIHHEAQTIKLIFCSSIIVRFKKGDDDHPGQNIPTQAVLDFLDPQQTLPGFPPAAKIEIMWQANDIGTEIAEVTVAARDGKNITWAYTIDEAEEGGSTGLFEFPVGPSPDDFSPLVVVKPSRKKGESK